MRKERSWLSDFAIASQSIQIFCFALNLHYVEGCALEIWLRLGKKNEKLGLSFCFALNLHYVEGCALEIWLHLAKKMKNLVFHFVLRSTCANFVYFCRKFQQTL
ncbi:MAG: hypothetical protein IJ160_08640 [Muribaculaceae bacterium]|nr:hypothetical protein [Muribaculaceae bacterium]